MTDSAPKLVELALIERVRQRCDFGQMTFRALELLSRFNV